MSSTQATNKALRVVIADYEPGLLEYYRAILASMGHEVVAAAADGEQLVAECLAKRPDLVIADIKMPGKDGVQAVLEVFREFPLRVILATGVRAPSHIHTALSEMVLAYLAKPFQQRELELAVERVEQRFVEFQALLASGDSPRQAVEHRKTLRLAKGILMKRNGLGDRAAFQHLQQLASEQNVTLVEVAHRVITAEKAVQARPSALQDGNQVSSRS